MAGIKSDGDEERKFGTLLDSTHNTFDRRVRFEPSGTGAAREKTREYEYKDSA